MVHLFAQNRRRANPRSHDPRWRQPADDDAARDPGLDRRDSAVCVFGNPAAHAQIIVRSRQHRRSVAEPEHPSDGAPPRIDPNLAGGAALARVLDANSE